MALDLKKLRAEQAARASGGPTPTPAAPPPPADLEAQLRSSLTADAAAVAHALDDRRADLPERAVTAALAINRPDAPPNPNAPGAVVGAVLPTVVETTGVEADPATDPEFQKELAAPEPRRGRGRPRKHRESQDAYYAAEAKAAGESGRTDPVVEELEAFATAAQGVADAADALVSRLNAALRARGVRL